MNPRLIAAKPPDNYEPLVTFTSGERGVFDVKPLFSLSMYRPLLNKGLFATAKADGTCVC